MSEITQELIKITGIKDFSNLSLAENKKLLKLIGEHKLSEMHVNALVKISPDFIKGQIKALNTISDIAKGMKASQKEAIKPSMNAIEGITEILKVLAAHADSDEAREKLADKTIEAAEIYLKIMKENRKINQDNNDTWLSLGKFVVTVLAIGASVGAAALSRK